jgi:TRAP transporter TAXI family solute receptor
LAGSLVIPAEGARAQRPEELIFFRIGTGSPTGTYFPIGSLIADAISSPPGTPPCELGGSCGVAGLVAAAVTTSGSVENIARVLEGDLESGLAQSDVAYWAYTGSGTFADAEAATSLRALASLYAESLHLVVAGSVEATTPAGLRGLRVALDDEGSGTLVDARLVLSTFGLSERDIVPFYVKPQPAAAMMAKGELDAFFMVGGWPLLPVLETTQKLDARLMPIEGEVVDALVEKYPFFSHGVIPDTIYPGIPATPTINVHALWIVTEGLDTRLAYGLTQALWHPRTAAHLAQSHPRGADITLATALDGVAIPLHVGAQKYYREQGLPGVD